jgi:DNA-binding transcriptional regulator YdaS (Cro superfamily)
MSIESLQKAVGILGGQTATAKALSRSGRKISQTHIWNWLNSPNPDQMPPSDYCPDIELATNGRVTCEQLRPDVNWSVLRCSGSPESDHKAAEQQRGGAYGG